MDPILEELQTLGEAEAAAHRLDDVEVDPPGPHAGLRPLFGGRTDQGPAGLLVEVLDDRRHLGDEITGVGLEGRDLSGGVSSEVLRLAVLAGHEIDLDEFDVATELGDGNGHDARVGPDTREELHGKSCSDRDGLLGWAGARPAKCAPRRARDAVRMLADAPRRGKTHRGPGAD